MRDPDEGVDAAGFIVTGVRRDRVPSRYEPILTEAADAIAAAAAGRFEGLYLYGSVATGQARAPGSDVDLLALVQETPATTASGIAALATDLSARHADVAREVAIAVMDLEDLSAPGLDGAANRAFLRHYCVHLAGADHASALPAAMATPSLAFAFNRDGRERLTAIREDSDRNDDPALLGALATRAARTLLLVAASYASALRGAWTTDRATGAAWLSQDRPALAATLRRARELTDGPVVVDRQGMSRFLDAAIKVVADFETEVGAGMLGIGNSPDGTAARRKLRPVPGVAPEDHRTQELR